VGKNSSFSLDDHYAAFIEGEIAAGRYRSASDVVRSALRSPLTGRAGYRKLAAGSHVLFYRVMSEGDIDVARVLHRRMDVDRHL